MSKFRRGSSAVEQTAGSGGLPREVLLVLPGLLLAMLVAMLDNMIVGPAMPRIVGDLGGASHLAWVVTAYTLATTVSTPLYGKLGDLYGRKRLFMTAIVIFLVGSALSGLAQSMIELIAFRGLQGIGAGGLIVGVMAIIGEMVPPRERGRIQGYMSAVMAVAMIGGPLVGGFLTDHLSWRWSFYVNIPLGAITLLVIGSTLHLPRHKISHRIDYFGAALLTAAASSLVLLATWGGTQYAWDSAQIIGLGILGVVATVAFIAVELRVDEPILPMHVFRNRNFSLASSLQFLVGFGMFGGMMFLPFYQQIVQGASATNSGLLLLPLLLGMLVTSLISGQIMTRTGRYKAIPIVGGAALAMGLFLLSVLTVDTTRVVSSLYMVVVGIGLGCLMNVTMTVAQNSVELKDIGVASSTSTFFRTIGGSFGVSIFGAIFTSQLSHGLSGGASGLAKAGTNIDPSVLDKLPTAALSLYQHAVTHATTTVFTAAIAFGVAAFLLAMFVKEVPLRGSTPTVVKESAPEELALVD
jgi:EmrB/QacA subfamily drug resistance transporter